MCFEDRLQFEKTSVRLKSVKWISLLEIRINKKILGHVKIISTQAKIQTTVEPRFSVSKYSVNPRFSVIFLRTKMNFVKQIE